MKGVTSPVLDDIQIVRYVEGEADEAILAHIRACAFCRERVNQWTLLQNDLRKQLYRASCPTSMELGDYHLGLLPASQELVIAQHVRECPLCRREVAELGDFLEELAPEVSLLGAAKVLIARLVRGPSEFAQPRESDLLSAGMSLRGGAKGPITLEAEGVVIVLDLQQTEEGTVDILGQVAAGDQDQWTEALVEIRQDNELQFSATVDDLGAFRLTGIMPGSKELRIRSKDNSLTVVSNFDVLIE
jgi:hypothetical protein